MRPIKQLGLAAAMALLAGTAGAQDTYFPGVFRDEYYIATGTATPSTAGVESGSLNPFNAVASGYTYTDALDFNQLMEIPFNNGTDNYVRHVSGVFVAPITTNYVFWIESDDDSQLFLSTDATPANKRIVAQENNWSNTGQWTSSGGGSSLPNKRSDQFIPPGATFPPYATGFPMIAGSNYYIEVFHHEGGGGENFQVTYTYAKGGAPVGNGTAITNTGVGTPNFGYLVHPPHLFTVGGLSNITAYSGRTVTFAANVATDETPYPLTYQWYASNSLTGGKFVALTNSDQYVGSGLYALGSSGHFGFLTVHPSTNDNGSAVYCVVGFTNFDTVLLPSITNMATSIVATLTVRPDASSVLVTGGLKKEFYNEIPLGTADRGMLEVGPTVGPLTGEDLGYVSGPTSVFFVPSAVDPANSQAVNYVERFTGYYTPTNSDNYNFYISSDDDTDFYISTDNTPSNKRLIAQETGWSNTEQWITANSGSSSQKSSLTWSPDGGTTFPYSSGIALTAGKAYYVEAVHHQGGGGANFGFTVESFSGTQPTNNQPTDVDPSQLSFLTSPTTKLNITANPTDQSVFSGGLATFKANASSDSELTPVFQWQQNGTNLAGATTTILNIQAVPVTDNGYTYQFIATIPGSAFAATSTVASLTVQSSVLVSNVLKKEFWGTNGTVTRDGPDPALEDGTAGLPDYTAGIPLFFCSNDGIINYAQRISGFFIPPQTTNYIFFIESDDDSDLFLSTDNTAANKKQIAAETGWSNQGQWNTSAAPSNLAQKRSDTFLPSGATVPPYSAGIPLIAGHQYYIEADHHQGNGGERVEVTFATVYENQTFGIPADGDATRIDANYAGPFTVASGYAGPAGIAFNAPKANFVEFTTQPVGGTTNVGAVFTLSAVGLSDSVTFFQPGVATSVNPPTQLVTYQWLSNGVPIVGAINPTYTTSVLLPANSGDTYTVQIGAIGYAGLSNSLPAVITINPDHTPPTVTGTSYAYADQYGNFGVTITYSKTLDGSVTNPANYTVAGQTVLGVNLLNGNQVELLLSGFPASPFQVIVNGVKDLAGNTIAANTHVTSTVFTALTSIDIDPTLGDPAVQGYFIPTSTNSFIIAAGGSDIWNANDGFRFTYLQKTGDFDVAVNVTSVTPVDQFSKAGLMIREDLTSYSRNWDIVTEPLAVPTHDAGTGNNAVEGDQRDTAGIATDADWAAVLAPYHPGDFPPQYPNEWLRIARVGDNFFGYQSYDGHTWVLTMEDSPTNHGAMTPFPSPCYVGIAVTAHNNTLTGPNDLNVSTFQNFQDTATLPIPTVPATITATLSLSGNSISVSWTPAGGRLQTTTSIQAGGTVWTDVGTVNPTVIPVLGAPKFFRVVNP